MRHETIHLFEGRGVDNSNIFLKTYLTEDLNGMKRPAVIVIPGGAFITIGTREGESVALAYAAKGYQAFLLHYSTLRTAPDSSGLDNMLEQVKEAIKIISDHADEWCVDADKISLTGFSAGGGLAACYSIYYKRMGGIRPNAVVLSYPILDHKYNLEWLYETRGGDDDFIAMSFAANKALFATETPSEEQIEKASPARSSEIVEDIPPTFIWHTFGDHIVSPINSITYAKKLYEAGVPCELHIFERGEHALALANETTAADPSQINEEVAVWFDMALKWLKMQN